MPMLFHKPLRSERMTCAGAVGVMSKLGRLPLIARLGLVMGLITKKDIEASAAMVIDPPDVQWKPASAPRHPRGRHYCTRHSPLPT